MSENVISLQEYRPHLEGPVICMHCKHEWRGVSPVGRYAGLECPRCNLETGVRRGLIWPENKMYRCDCGSNIFFICGDRGAMCIMCGDIYHETDGPQI